MEIKLYKPTTPARRRTSVDDFSDITSKRSLKNRIQIKKSQGGRNNTGKITVRHRGGGAKNFYRQVDFKQDKFDIQAKLIAVEYDPNRSVRIGVLAYADGEKRYILLPEGVKVGQVVTSSKKAIKPEIGNRMPLEFIPVGMFVHNVELTPGKGGEIVRSAGTSAQFMALEEGGLAQLRLPSGEIRAVTKECLATIGQLSGQQHRHIRIGKAGRRRHMGFRPSVRGKAMNPVDHPHGGGEGHNPIGLKHPKTPWGKPARGVKTRKHGKYSDKLIIQRRKKRK
ncbi:MAG: 50S ribosomal protein L2 [Patescibacteria group bacterium]|jgi:large subunit ribosomal protein L2